MRNLEFEEEGPIPAHCHWIPAVSGLLGQGKGPCLMLQYHLHAGASVLAAMEIQI